MDLTPWPEDFARKKRGEGCPQCETGRVAETEHGVRYFEGTHADGYLQRDSPALGYSVVVFRGRHVGDPQSMTPREQAGFWTDVSTVARAIEAAFKPIHLNFQILGNQDPHVHVHIVPRFDPDPAPSLPLPAEAWATSSTLTPPELTSQIEALQTHLPPAKGDGTTESHSMYCTFCGERLGGLPPTHCDHCGEPHWNNPKPCGSAIVERDGKALLVKRARDPWRGHWDIPGGFCDPAELPADAAVREVAEEAGLADIELTEYLGVWIDTYPDERADRSERPVESTINHCFLARSASNDPVRADPGEVLEARFFGADELPEDIAFPAHIRPALEAWILRRRPGTTEGG